MKHVTKFRAMSTVDMAALYALAVEEFGIEGVDAPTDFDTKALGQAKTSALLAANGLDLELGDDGQLSVVRVSAPEADEPETGTEGDDPTSGADNHEPFEGESEGDEPEAGGDEPEAAETPAFVKLPKDQLPARGTPEREAYRKARRAAARALRKAREAA